MDCDTAGTSDSRCASITRSVVVVSTHLDDAILSVGLTLIALTKMDCHAAVVTVFADAPSGKVSHVAQHFNEANGDVLAGLKRRRDEDTRAARYLHVAPVHLGFVDASFRRTMHGHWLLNELGSAVCPASESEDELKRAIADAVWAQCDSMHADTILAPLAVGGHIDHLLVREAVEKLAGRGRRLVFYEDLPYAAMAGGVAPEIVKGLAPIVVRGTTGDLERKLTAIGCYASQTRFFPQGSGGTWEEVFVGYATQLVDGPAERLWSIPSSDVAASTSVSVNPTHP